MTSDQLAPAALTLPPVAGQVQRLRSLGLDVPTLPDLPDALVALAPGTVRVHDLAPLLAHRAKPGFVVEDLTDVEEFLPTVELPTGSAYLVTGLDRGDDLLDWRPSEALPELESRGRSPLTLQEGISWLLQVPEALEDNHCFMTIGSRRAKGRPGTYDARTPAIWISRGTGRDASTSSAGAGARRNAPKVGWCWWNNKHTWLGFASCRSRLGSTAEAVSS